MSYRYTRSGHLRLSSKRKKSKGGQNLKAWRINRAMQKEDFTDNCDDDCMTIAEHTVQHEENCVIQGRRIVDINFFLEKVQELNNHSNFGCTFSDMCLISEDKSGFRSGFKFRCKMCNIEKILWTEDISKNRNINTDAATGIMSIGCGYSNMEELFSIMDIPSMCNNTFIKEHDRIFKAWEETALAEMEAAANKEKELAIENGEVDNNGVPLLTVVVDGSWAKRSYRTNYSSLSGVAVIVGFYTRKVLYIGVRNKYCYTCAWRNSKNLEPIEHTCYKNWNGSSSGMEASIIAEGFQKSMEMYGVKYSKMIGDGDSNVYKLVLDSRPYDDITVEKIECKNHLLRNVCNKLRDVIKNGKYGPVQQRKLLGANIKRLCKAVIAAARYRKNEVYCSTASSSFAQLSSRIKKLKSDIVNVPMHVFGDHKKCDKYFCRKKNSKENNSIPDLKQSGLLYKILEIFNTLADNARSLLFDSSSNSAESFNSIVAKFIGGKRINYCYRGSYQARCNAAAVAHNSNTPNYKIHKALYNCSPGKYTKILEKKRARLREYAKKNKRIRTSKKLFSLDQKKSVTDKNYGPFCQKPDISEMLFLEKKEKFLKSLELSNEEIIDLEKETFLQRDSALWLHERRKRLTASNFGSVCSKLPYTKCDNLIKSILYRHFDNDALSYGRQYESDAVNSLKVNLAIEVRKCGFFVDKEMPYLGATPDGLVGDDGIVEIKCPSSCQALTPEDAITSKKFTFWVKDRKTQEISLNKKHKYYFQVQGQLHITQKTYCLFVLWTPSGIKIEKIERDDSFWENKMKKKLQDFYMECLLPELIDPRYPRSMDIRNPQTILNAMKERENKKKEVVSTEKIPNSKCIQ